MLVAAPPTKEARGQAAVRRQLLVPAAVPSCCCMSVCLSHAHVLGGAGELGAPRGWAPPRPAPASLLAVIQWQLQGKWPCCLGDGGSSGLGTDTLR